jgi:site-specific DNA recombinase
LARESIIGMPILKKLVYVFKARVISVTEGLDSNREGWEMLAQLLLMQHERYVKELSHNVSRHWLPGQVE